MGHNTDFCAVDCETCEQIKRLRKSSNLIIEIQKRKYMIEKAKIEIIALEKQLKNLEKTRI